MPISNTAKINIAIKTGISATTTKKITNTPLRGKAIKIASEMSKIPGGIPFTFPEM